MEFRIADTFTDSLSRLTGDEQKAVKTTAFDLQLNPEHPSLSFHRLDRAKDKNFWSIRVNSNIRAIVHKSDASLLLCYVDHHDRAYDWANKRKLETHPKTGAAQLVEIRETVQDIVIPNYVHTEVAIELPLQVKPSTPIFGSKTDDELLSYGIPVEWLDDVKNVMEDSLLELCDHLPAEASEALLELATGGKPRIQQPVVPTENPFDHPDAQRRFRVMTNIDELQQALDYPWEKWTVFLHPEQKQLVDRDYSGPARVSGSAGTGKTIVALHRAAYLARANPDSRVLLTTFSDTLASALQTKLKRLLGSEPRLAERIDVYSINAIGVRLYKSHIGSPAVASREVIIKLIKEALKDLDSHKFTQHFLLTEWDQVVDAWQLANWEDYRVVARLGRKTRLPEQQRSTLWTIFERVKASLKDQGLLTYAQLFTSLANNLNTKKSLVYDFTVVDEAQDISISHLKFFLALGGDRNNALFFAGDLGQRIFQQPFSWKSIGVDIRGRSRTLRVNYRTSHQIRLQADKLLAPSVVDVDGNVEDRSDTISVFNGPQPTVLELKNNNAEITAVSTWIKEQLCSGLLPHEIGVFVRSNEQIERAESAVKDAELNYKILDEHVETQTGNVSISTMHLAKGLEFRAVVVMACDDEIIPLQERIETVGDDADLQEVYDTERQLLYVACTRARDYLLVTAVEPRSEFLDDMSLTHHLPLI
jgi:hypothetical protein